MILTDFEWCGQSGSLYGLLPCYINSSSEIAVNDGGATIEFNTSNISSSNKWNFLSSKYSNVLSGTFQVCKNPCITTSTYFDTEDLRAMNRWLCQKNGYHKFKIIKEEGAEYPEFYFNAFLNVKKIEAFGHVIGLEITVTTDAPFAYFEPKKAIMNLSAPDLKYIYIDMSDEVGTLYPTYQITCHADGDYVIKNTLSGIQSKILNCCSGEIIYMDSEHKIISSNIRNDDLIKSFNFGWLDIQNTLSERKNIYSANLPCKIEMMYSPIAKIDL